VAAPLDDEAGAGVGAGKDDDDRELRDASDSDPLMSAELPHPPRTASAPAPIAWSSDRRPSVAAGRQSPVLGSSGCADMDLEDE
jgi:hypothetical protein